MKSYLYLVVVALFLTLGACSVEEPGPMIPACGAYTHVDAKSGMCVADWPNPPCAEGTHVQNGVCVADITSPRCGHGTELINHTCVPKKDTCGEGTEWKDGKCVPTHESVEVCDGVDNDGDGQIDNGSMPGVNLPCVIPVWDSSKERLFHQTGQYVCQDGSMHCRALCLSQEICGDGMDNTCDNQVDEGCNPPPPAVVTIKNVVQPWWTLTKNSNQNLMEFEVSATAPIKITSITVGVYLSNPTGNSNLRLYVDGQWVIFAPGKWGSGNGAVFYPHTPVSSVPVRFTVTGDTTELPGNPGDFVQMTMMGLTTDPTGVSVTGAGISGPLLVFK